MPSLDTGIALLALVISGISLWKSHKTEAKTQKKANLISRLEREPQRNFMRITLVIENLGESEARNVEVKLDGAPLLEHACIPDNVDEIERIGQHSFIRYPFAVTMGNAGPYEIMIKWKDNTGEPGYYFTSLTL